MTEIGGPLSKIESYQTRPESLTTRVGSGRLVPRKFRFGSRLSPDDLAPPIYILQIQLGRGDRSAFSRLEHLHADDVGDTTLDETDWTIGRPELFDGETCSLQLDQQRFAISSLRSTRQDRGG